MAPVCLRDLTPAECAVVQTLAHSRTAPAHRVQRAQIIWRARCGESASAIAARVGLDGETVRKRIRRFNAEGLEALKDRPRSGRRPTYSPEQTATVIASALSKPQTLGLPFAAWTLDRLAAYLHEHKGIAMQRSRIDEILLHEGLRWHKHETWFGERVNPAFAEKRGAIETLYTKPPAGRCVVCLDEMGPVSAKSYAGRAPVSTKTRPAERAKQEIDYGRRAKGYIFGAFRPATGESFTQPYSGRGGANWVDFLAHVEAWFPRMAERVYAIMDNLSSHRTTDVLLFVLAHPRWEMVFQPKYAAYLNLIEP
jgi:transposase